MKKIFITLTFLFCTFYAYSQKTWYTYKSGNWNDATSWTLDGATNPSYKNDGGETPNANDNIVITSSRNITILDNTSLPDFNGTLEIIGTLNFATSDGNSTDGELDTERYFWNEIKGDGTILFEGYDKDGFYYDNLPTANNWDRFEGTFIAKGNHNIYMNETQSMIYNLDINFTNTKNELVLLADYSLRKDLNILKGGLRVNQNKNEFGSNEDGSRIDFLINGSITISSEGSLKTGNGGVYSDSNSSSYHDDWHTITVGGDFTNDGIVVLSSLSTYNPNYRAGDLKAATLYFTGANHNTFLINNTTTLYNLVIDKGDDRTYQLTINVTNDADDFYILGYNSKGKTTIGEQDPVQENNLYIASGTLNLEGKTHIRSLTERGGGIYTLGQRAGITLNGAETRLDFSKEEGRSMYINGELKINDGAIYTKESVLSFAGKTGSIIVNGGYLETTQIRTSTEVDDATLNFTQTGGIIQFGDQGEHAGYGYAVLSLNKGGITVNLLGGEIIFDRTHTISLPIGFQDFSKAIHIETTHFNVNAAHLITVNMVEEAVTDSDQAFYISSNIPLGNLTIQETQNKDVYLQSDLELLGDLHIQKDVFNASTHTLTLHGNMIIENPDNEDVVYNATENTTIFKGNTDSYINLTSFDSEQRFENLQIDKEGATLKLIDTQPAENIIRVDNLFELLNGTLDNRNHSVRLLGDVTNYGTLGIYDENDPEHDNEGAYIKFRANDPENPDRGFGYNTIQTSSGAKFGNVRLNTNKEVMQFTSDVHIDRLQYRHGRIELGTYNLEIGELVESVVGSEADPSPQSDWQEEDMFLVSGNASDGGLSLKITEEGVYTFPLGINLDPSDDEGDGKYTPLEIKVENVTSEGYISISIEDDYLQTVQQDIATDELLSYYWRVDHYGFDGGLPRIEYIKMTANDEDIKGDGTTADNASLAWVAGRVLDESPYTREDGNDGKGFSITGNEITFGSDGNEFTLDKANYTAGIADKFDGDIQIFYSYVDKVKSYVKFNDADNWTTNPDHTTYENAGSEYPQEGDIAVIGYFTHDDAEEGSIRFETRNSDITLAELIFNSYDGAGIFQANNEKGGLSRLLIDETDKATIGKISGIGDILLDYTNTNEAILEGDVGDFTEQDSSCWTYGLRSNNHDFIISNQTDFPGLRVYGGTHDGSTVTFNNDITVKSLLIDGDANLEITNDISVEGNVKLGLTRSADVTFKSGDNHTFAIGGDLQLDNQSKNIGAKITVEDAGSHEHTLKVGGDLDFFLASTFDLNTPSSNAILEFTGSNDAEFTTNDQNIDIDLYRIKMSKDTSKSFTWNQPIHELTSSSNSTAETKPIVLESGTLTLNNSNISQIISSGGANFYIPGGSELEVQAGTLKIEGTASNGLSLDGTLKISGGNFLMDENNAYIEYSASGNARIDISDGNLLVGGYLRGIATNENQGILDFHQTGGNFVVGFKANEDSETNGQWASFDLDNASSFTLSGGTNSNFIIADLYTDDKAFFLDHTITINQASDTYIQFGAEDTNFDGTGVDISTNADATTFTIDVAPTLTNVKLNPHTTFTGWKLLLEESAYDLSLSQNLEIATNTTFEIETDRTLNIGGNLINEGTITTADNTTTIFNGASNQEISGSGSTNFYDFIHSGTSDLRLSKEITVNHDFSHLEGSFTTTGNTLDLKGNIQIDKPQYHLDNDGNGISFTGTSTQYINGTGTFARLHINNDENVEIADDNGGITIDGKLILEKGIFNVNRNLLTLKENTTIEDETGGTEVTAFSASNMISTNGSEIDQGIRKEFSEDYATTFVFPIGRKDATAKYTPLEIQFTNHGSLKRTDDATPGFITVKAENAMIPTVINDVETTIPQFDDTQNVLQYYWYLDAQGLSIDESKDANAEVKFQFTFVSEDALFNPPVTVPPFTSINENYVSALLSKNAISWDKQSGNVSDPNFIWEFEDGENDGTISGYYTAGVGYKDDKFLTGTNGAIPDDLAFFITKASGDYSDISTWDTDKSTQDITDGVGPVGGVIIIDDGHKVTVDKSFRVLKTYIHENAQLIFGNNIPTDLGAVSGASENASTKISTDPISIPNEIPGTLKFDITEVNGFVLPRYYWNNPNDSDDDCDVNFEFTGSVDYTVPIYNARNMHIDVGTSNTITLPDNKLEICQDLTLTNGIVTQHSSQIINVRNNFETKNASVFELIPSATLNVTQDAVHHATTDLSIGSKANFLVEGNLSIGNNARITNQTEVNTFHVKGNTDLSGMLTIDSKNDIDLDGHLTVENTGTLNGNSNESSLKLGGNLNNAGTFNLSDTYLELDGSNQQTISGISAINNMRLNNTGTGLSLNTDFTVNTNIDLLEGVFTTSAILSLTNQDIISNGSQHSFIDGMVKLTLTNNTQYKRIPLGNNNVYKPLEIYPVDNDQIWSLQYFHANPENISENKEVNKLSSLADNGYFTITPNIADKEAYIQIPWDVDNGINWGVTQDILDKKVLRIAYFNPSNSEGWTSLDTEKQDGTEAIGNIQYSTPITFENSDGGTIEPFYFTLGINDGSKEVLPVTLLYFNATRTLSGSVSLIWETASEWNNKGFQIERSTDGIHFKNIGWVSGQGSSDTPIRYTFEDPHPQLGKLIYRLRQVDFSNRIQGDYYTSIQPSNTGVKINVYPNPISSSDHLKLLYAGLSINSNALLEVRNINGILVDYFEFNSGKNGIIDEQIPVPQQTGMYLFSLRINGKVYTKRIIVE